MNFLRLFIITIVVFVSNQSYAAKPTPQQIEQIKRLPKAQQEALAKQYGITLPSTQARESTGVDYLNELSILPRESKEKDDENDLDKKFSPKKEEIKPFGYELFSGQPTTFMPPEMAPITDDYLIGVGDEVKINLYGKTTDEFYLTIDREGRLSIPNLSPINVIGLSFAELKKLVSTKIQEEMIGVQSYITMGSLNSMRVMIVGEAYRPGSYMISPLASVTHALFVAGGVNERGSLRNIQVKRAGKLIANFDLYDLLLSGDSSNDIILKSGDVVFIPPSEKRITVKGEVNREAIFELKDSDNYDSILTMIGGFKANANKNKVAISRYDENGSRIALNIDFSKESNYSPMNGDEIVVLKVSDRLQNTVTVLGAVTNPGNFQWKEGQTIRQLFENPREEFLAIADYTYSLVIREANLVGRIELIQFSLEDVIVNQNQDVTLKPYDTVVIFSRYQFKEDEEQLLSNLAFSQEQIKHRNSVQLWEKYEKEKFLRYIGEFDEANSEKSKGQLNKTSLQALSIDMLTEQSETQNSENVSVFSRRNLLPAILSKLQNQSSHEEVANVIAVNGEVRFPGVYPLSQNASIADAVAAAGGYKESAYLGKLEVTRLSTINDSKQVKHLTFNRENEAEIGDLTLLGKDTLTVFPKPNAKEKQLVKLGGEVVYPGIYTIYRGEKLGDVIRRAGGFTEYAHKKAAIFTRESLKDRERTQIQRLSQELRRDIVLSGFEGGQTVGGGMSFSDMDRIVKELASIDVVGRLVIDIDNEESLALSLEYGDALYIPSKQNSVSVIGEVYMASTHIFEPNKNLSDYISASGGTKPNADEDRIYIIKANGAVVIPNNSSWFSVASAQSKVEPGDSIVVPLNTEQSNTLTLWTQATQIIYQLGLAAASIATLNK